MKNLHFKKIIYAVAGGLLGLALFISLSNSAYSALGGGGDPVGESGIRFTTAGGAIGVDQFQLSGKPDMDSNSEVLSVLDLGNDGIIGGLGNEEAIFRMVGTSIFDRILSFGQARFNRIAIGYPSMFDFQSGHTDLQVDGTISIKGLAHDGSSAIPACVNDFGKIVACDTTSYSCTGATPENSQLCTDDDQNLTSDIAKDLVSTCSSPDGSTPYCEYECSAGYVYNSCFVADTLVSMANGTKKDIQDIVVGEYVLGDNGEVSIVRDVHTPTLAESTGDKVYAFNGGRYFVTEEHPFKTTEGWKAINPVEAMSEHKMTNVTELHIGDTLITEEGEVLLETIEGRIEDDNTQLYNLILGGNHTYFADGYLVHNAKTGGGSCDPIAGPVNGVCGSSHTQIFSSPPSTNLCSAGTASAVTDNTMLKGADHDYEWTCAGENGGTTASCWAEQGTTTYSCTGSTPSNATLCTNDDQGLTTDIARTAVSACSSPEGSAPKCEYKCNIGYTYSNGSCVGGLVDVIITSSLNSGCTPAGSGATWDFQEPNSPYTRLVRYRVGTREQSGTENWGAWSTQVTVPPGDPYFVNDIPLYFTPGGCLETYDILIDVSVRANETGITKITSYEESITNPISYGGGPCEC